MTFKSCGTTNLARLYNARHLGDGVGICGGYVFFLHPFQLSIWNVNIIAMLNNGNIFSKKNKTNLLGFYVLLRQLLYA